MTPIGLVCAPGRLELAQCTDGDLSTSTDIHCCETGIFNKFSHRFIAGTTRIGQLHFQFSL